MNAPSLWLWDFPTHEIPSVKTDRSLAPFNNRETRPRKRKYSQTTDVQPETMHHPHLHPPPNRKLQFPLLPLMNKSVQLPGFAPGKRAYSFQEKHYTACKKAKSILSKPRGRHNMLTNHLRISAQIQYRFARYIQILPILTITPK